MLSNKIGQILAGETQIKIGHMNYSDPQLSAGSSPIHWGHFGIIMLAVVSLLGLTWMKNPAMFDFHQAQTVSYDSLPHYYAYVTPPEDQPKPAVLGANTTDGPQIINDDGTVEPVDLGQVLAATTAGVDLNPQDVKVNEVADSTSTIQNYFGQASELENGPIDSTEFENALSSQDQNLINQQATKILSVRDGLSQLAVPHSLVKLHQLTIIQYDTALELLKNFNQADSNPEQVGQDVVKFLKSQQDLNTENVVLAQELGPRDPYGFMYVNDDGMPKRSVSSSDSGASTNISSDEGSMQNSFINLNSGGGDTSQ